MRLRHIKIAGFKSFADPVTVSLEKPFTGIVGPNGCGKSNIIDAVRWVLGEARLSELRGSSSMKELIFSGSSGRKPLGRASVELLLTNEDARIKGPWGEYAELTIKRVVMADGQSQYFINQQQVRRRDVLDIFLGTGLGPRSYAIISQGMISSFIKAKPEELRVYFEEAAGVSLYRERRRETEQLIVQTQGNLERVNDALAIKEQEHERLKGEAAVVDRWEALNAEKLAAEALWYFIQHEDARCATDELAAKRAKAEAALAELKRRIDLANTQIRTLQEALQPEEAALNLATAKLREAEKRLTLQESEERQRAERLRALEAAIAESAAELKLKQARLADLSSQAENGAEEIEGAQEALEMLEDEVAAREDAFERAQDSLESETRASAEAARSRETVLRELDAAKARLSESERQAEALAQRLLRLEENAKRLSPPDQEVLTEAQTAHEAALEALEEQRAAAEQSQSSLVAARSASEAAAEAYFAALSRQKEALTKLESLEAAAEKAQAGERLATFEQEQGLTGLKRLHEVIDVEDEWIGAVDAVLGHRTNGVLLRMLQSALFNEKRPPAPLAFIDATLSVSSLGALSAGSVRQSPPEWVSLRSHIKTSDAAVGAALDEWLSGLWCIGSLKEGLAARAALLEGERFITPEGDSVSRVGIEYWSRETTEHQTLLDRLALEKAEQHLEETEDELERCAKARAAAAEQLTRLENQSTLAQQRLDVVRREEAQRLLALKTLEQQDQAWRERQADLTRDRTELEREAHLAQQGKEQALELVDERQAVFDRQSRVAAEVQHRLERAQETFRLVSAQLNDRRRELATTRVRLEAVRKQRADASLSLEHVRGDCQRELVRQEKLMMEYQQLKVAVSETKLGEALEAFKKTEAAHAAQHRVLEEKRAELSRWIDALKSEQAEILPLTDSISAMRVEEENKSGLREQFSARLTELGADRLALAHELQTDRTKATGARNRVLKLMSEIEALGPINHAAKTHLQAIEETLRTTREQIADLEVAISTLQEAIRKIDQETRMTMRETFEAVKGHFASTFTHLFSGGSASLELVGDDILNAGVEVRAQPPGKKNSTLRLLSGGEQALTATALVFALFKLNPAPFCLLDEVDAPLDEANQARLANMCRAQSAETQFLMITHHRVTMEFAQALIGVTMREPGVSRVVSVDIEEASKMAA